MEEKRINELSDEALDTVTGGASYRWNEETGEYDVSDKNGKKVASCADEKKARAIAASLTLKETHRVSRS